MKFPYRFIPAVVLGLSVLAVSAHAVDSAASAKSVINASTMSGAKPALPVSLDVYKSPTCGCCEKWITYLEGRGATVAIHHPADMNAHKASLSIAPKYQSCHTAVTATGYVFEGHVPAPIIQRFLLEKPKDAIGLAVPGMPMGSPGMEMGDHFEPYDVLLLKADGSSSVYAHIATAAQQH